jgi:hypothetical protein
VLVDKPGNGRNHAFLVGATQQKDGGVFHSCELG